MKTSALIPVVLLTIIGDLVGAKAFAQTTDVDLKVADETIPPGETVQIKTFLTEPKPISGGKGVVRMNKSLVLVKGIAAFSTKGDLSGVAQLANGLLQVRCVSPSLTWGADPDYPLFVVAAQVSPSVQIGSEIPLPLVPSASWWLNATGQPYPQEVHAGTLSVGGTLSISDVIPGGGPLPAGTLVRVLGSGFESNTSIQVNEIKTGNVTVVNSGEIDFTLEQAADLTGARIRVSGSGGARVEYFSYLRGIPDGASQLPAIAAVTPIFPTQYYSSAVFPIPATGFLTAVSVQNPNTSTATVTAQVYSSANALLGSVVLQLASGHLATRELSELFGSIMGAAYVRISSVAPLQTIAFKLNEANGAASPIYPVKAK